MLGFWGLGCPQRVLRIGKYEPLGEYITVLENALLVRGTQKLYADKNYGAVLATYSEYINSKDTRF